MKECRYCRTKYDDNLAVCPNCGATKVITAQELAEEAAYIQRESEYREKANAARKVHKKRLIGILATVVVVIIAVIAVISINANKPLSNGMTKDEGEKVLASGIAYLDNGDYEAAIDCFLQLPSDSKQYKEAQSLLLQSQDSYRSDILSKVDEHISKGEFDSAFSLISKVQELLPDDSELRASYDNVYTGYVSSVLDQVNSYVSEGQYEMALEYLKGVQAKYPNDATLQDSYSSTLSAYQSVVRTDAIEQADSFVAEGDYASAIKTVNAALDKIGLDETLSAKLSVYSNEYSSVVIKAAKDQYKEYNFESIENAKKMITSALEVMPNDSTLTSELNFYEQKTPTDIMSLPTEDSDFYIFTRIGEVTDNQGVSHENAVNLSRFAWINTDYQYTKLTGVFFQSGKYSNSPIYHTLKIYGEHEYSYWGGKNLIWEGRVNGDSTPVYLDIDVGQYRWLEFVMDDWDGNEMTYMADMCFWN